MSRKWTSWMQSGLAAAAAGLLALGGLAQQLHAQQSAPPKQAELAIPTASSMVRLEALSPSEVRVGESYQYKIRVTNITDDVVLHNVTIEQQSPNSFEVQSSKLESSDKKKQDKKQDKKSKDQQGSKQASQQSNQKAGKGSWKIDQLMPGQSQTISVTAVSDQEGSVKTCLAVTSYTPALCLTTQFVKPEIEIAKRAPKTATLCEAVTFRYEVSNKGSGPSGELQVRDDLPSGLTTVDGKKKVTFTIDELGAGQSKTFDAKVVAEQRGDFTSRAVAVQTSSDSRSQSKKAGTKFQAADVAVALEGPGAEYIDRPMHYTIRITNKGNAPARDAELQLKFDGALADFAKAGDLQSTDKAVQSNDDSQSKPTPASSKQQQASKSKKQDSKQKNQRKDAYTQTWQIGTLKPQESRKLTFTLVSREQGMLRPQATVRFVCDRDAAVDTTAQALTQTEVIALPALLLAVVDTEDPVPVDGATAYNIIVRNQGSAADHNIKLSAQLPEQLKFVNAEGPSKIKADGRQLSFEPIKKLEPGKRLAWKVHVKAVSAGGARFKVDLSSDGLSQTTESEEPTRLFAADGSRTASKDEESTTK